MESSDLTVDIIEKGLNCLGQHPILKNHAFLELNISASKTIKSIDALGQYPHLMYINISDNQIEDISVFALMPTLTQLIARKNCIRKCLSFSPPLCTTQNSWATGHKAVGSLLTCVDLTENLIEDIVDISDHRFLEILLLSRNQICSIRGLSTLRYLKVTFSISFLFV